MKIYPFLFSFILLAASENIYSQEEETYEYYQELEELKDSERYYLIFNKNMPQEIPQDVLQFLAHIENYKELKTPAERWDHPFHLLWCDSIAITDQNMPKLSHFVDSFCKNHNLKTPGIFITRGEGTFNMQVQKLFRCTGSILIGQKLINAASDRVIEAIIIHELGHIKYNHSNKGLAIYLPCLVASGGAVIYLINKIFKSSLFDRLRLNNIWIKIIAGVCGTAILAEKTTALVINKRFEKEADGFVCADAQRADDLIASFELAKKRENLEDGFYYYILDVLNENKEKLAVGKSYENLKLQYYVLQGCRKIDKAMRWLYYHTPFGWHPSYDERIKNAQSYLPTNEQEPDYAK